MAQDMPRYLGLLLHVVDAKSDSAPLERVGLTYGQIASLIQEARQLGYVSKDELVLTSQGVEYLQSYKHSRQRLKGADWIKPADEFRREKLSELAVYLPKAPP